MLATLTLASTVLAAAVLKREPTYPDNVEIEIFENGMPYELIPRSESLTELAKRAGNAGVFLCDAIQFKGYCVHVVQPKGQCVNLSGDLNDKVSSVGPDSPNYCVFSSAFNCDNSEGNLQTGAPGFKDLREVAYGSGGTWNDRISSYYCVNN